MPLIYIQNSSCEWHTMKLIKKYGLYINPEESQWQTNKLAPKNVIKTSWKKASDNIDGNLDIRVHCEIVKPSDAWDPLAWDSGTKRDHNAFLTNSGKENATAWICNPRWSY